MYHTEGPEIMRLYNEKDNSQHLTFTDVLDSAYNNVNKEICSGYVQNIITQCSSVPSFMPLSQSGQFIILMKKDHFHQNLEENMRLEDMQLDRKGIN